MACRRVSGIKRKMAVDVCVQIRGRRRGRAANVTKCHLDKGNARSNRFRRPRRQFAHATNGISGIGRQCAVLDGEWQTFHAEKANE